MAFDVTYALMAVLQHALVPFGVQHAGAAFECHLVGQCANDTGPTRLVTDIDRYGLTTLLFGCTADAAERVEVVVNGCDSEFDALEVLVGQVDAREHRGHELGLLRHLAMPAVGEALALGEHVAQLILGFPSTAIDQHVDVGAIGAIGVGEDPECGSFEVAVVGCHVGESMLPDEVHAFGLGSARCQPAGLGQHTCLQWQQVAENARQREHHVNARAAQFLDRQKASAA